MGTLQKIIATGLGTALAAEEELRKRVTRMNLPAEAKRYLLDQAERRKQDLSKIIARELKQFLDQLNVHRELRKALAGLKIHVNATVTLEPTACGPLRLNRRRASVKITKR